MANIKPTEEIQVKARPRTKLSLLAGGGIVLAFGIAVLMGLRTSQVKVAQQHREQTPPPSLQRAPQTQVITAGNQKGIVLKKSSDSAQPEFVLGEALVKFSSDNTVTELIQPRKKRTDGLLSTSDSRIQNIMVRHKVSVAKKIFPASSDANIRRVVKLRSSELTREQTLALVKDLQSAPDVEYAEPNYLFHTSRVEILPNESGGGGGTPSYAPNDPFYYSTGTWGQSYRDLWGTIVVNAQNAWSKTRGEGVIVAVIDTGIDLTHEDLQGNIWTNTQEIPGNGVDDDSNGFIDDLNGWNFNANTNAVTDDNGHGTHVAGTISAVMGNQLGIVGVAPKAKIMPLKGLGSSGSGTMDDLAAAIDYARLNGAKVINASWGTGISIESPQTLVEAVHRAYLDDVLFVAAAGNAGQDVGTPLYGFAPANFLDVLTVSAVDSTGARAYFSNFGAKIDVSAPGVDILSLRAAGTDLYCFLNPYYCEPAHSQIVGQKYYRMNGTSMAAPHVAAIAALFRSLGSFSVEQTRQAIRHAAVDLGNTGFDHTYGYGRVNAQQTTMEQSPLVVHLESPYGTLTAQTSTTIRGIVTGDGLVFWKLRWGAGSEPTTWTDIASGTTPQPALSQPWALNIPEGINVVSLIAITSKGVTYEDRLPFKNDNVVVTWPVSKPVSAAQPINILGTVAPYGLISYSVSLKDMNGIPVNLPITLPNGGQQPIRNGIIATMDARNVIPEHYQLIVTAHPASGYDITETTRFVLDPTLHPGWPVSITSLPPEAAIFLPTEQLAVGDLNRDGLNEIIIGYDNSLRVYRPDGSQLWEATISTPSILQLGPVVGDVNGDGQSEVALGDNGGYLHVWDASGNYLSNWPKFIGGNLNSLALDDIDGNGSNEIVAGSWRGELRAFSGNTGQLLWMLPLRPTTDYVASMPSIADIIPSRPGKEIAVTSDQSLFLVSSQGAEICRYNLAADPTQRIVIGDVDTNGDLEMVYADMNGTIHAFNEDCTTEPDGWPKTFARRLNTPAVGDINGDGRNEVVAGMVGYLDVGYVDELYAWNGTGQLLPGWPIQERYRVDLLGRGFRPPVLADIDGNGTADVISSLDSSTFSMRAYQYTGQEITQFPKPTAASGVPTNTASVSDLDGDGLFEVAWIDYNFNLYMWDVPGQAQSPKPWPMFQHDAQHTGALTSVR